VDAKLFAEDLAAKPAVLREWADSFGSPWSDLGITADQRIVLVGMGSSHYANAIGAARLRTHGIDATAVLASSDLLPAVDAQDVVIAVSASGGSVETRAAVEHYAGHARLIAMVNTETLTAISAAADAVVPMRAGVEVGGVACRSFQHTVALLLDLEATLVPDSRIAQSTVPSLLRASAEANADLLDRQDTWLDEISDLLLGPDGSTIVAPARRFCSAQQSALMLREGPRLPAVGCETGDWSHVDVYLTKTTDYRMLLLAGDPRWEPQLMEWCTKRGSTVIAAGAPVPGAQYILRYRNDDDDDVRLLSETLIAELIAARRWQK
jgi:glucosamine 6-phosphate synthetase-like amidotransferase/phosphosugar isomerase protein